MISNKNTNLVPLNTEVLASGGKIKGILKTWKVEPTAIRRIMAEHRTQLANQNWKLKKRRCQFMSALYNEVNRN